MPLSAPELHEAVLEATGALRDATRTLEETKRTHQRQIIGIGVVVLLVLGLFYLGYRESRHADRANCETIASGRSDLTHVLEIIVETGRGQRDQQEQDRVDALFQEILDEALPPVDCSNI